MENVFEQYLIQKRKQKTNFCKFVLIVVLTVLMVCGSALFVFLLFFHAENWWMRAVYFVIASGLIFPMQFFEEQSYHFYSQSRLGRITAGKIKEKIERKSGTLLIGDTEEGKKKTFTCEENQGIKLI